MPVALPSCLVDLARRQAGIVSRRQLRDAGVGDDLAESRVRGGRWQRIHLGTYALFSGPPSRTAQVWAALLRVGPGAVASHATAAELDELTGRTDDRVHVTAPVSRRVRSRIDNVVVHYAHRLAATRHPTKQPPRTRIEDTILDLIDASGTPRRGWRAGYPMRAGCV